MGGNDFADYKAKFLEGISATPLAEGQEKFIIRGELSGIQDYIFNIPSKGAAMYLKGRSAYLQLLPEAIARYVHNEINIAEKPDFEQSLVFSGGGNFMLVYNTYEDLTGFIDACHGYIEQVLLKYHNGRIYFALAGATTAETDYETTLAKKLYFRKKQKFATHPNGFKSFELLEKKPKQGEEYQSFYKSFRSLTQKFSTKKEEEIKIEGEGWENVLLDFKSSFEELQPFIKIIENEVANFDHLAEFAEGAKKLAILKIDVDNLGQLFAGRQPNAVAKISSALTYFFSTRLNELFNSAPFVSKEDKAIVNDEKTFEHYEKGSKLIYTVYSGGDDCFLIGPWHIMIELAGEINTAFKEFTNGACSLSASLTLIDESFPVIRGAVLASEQLEMAKGKTGKSAICIFNQVFGWEEWKYVLEIKNLLTNIIIQTQGNIKSVIRKVESTTATFAKIIDAAKKDQLKMQSIYRLKYYLRNFKTAKQELADIYQSIITQQFLSGDFFKSKNHDLKPTRDINYMIIPISCRLTELHYRAYKTNAYEN